MRLISFLNEQEKKYIWDYTFPEFKELKNKLWWFNTEETEQGIEYSITYKKTQSSKKRQGTSVLEKNKSVQNYLNKLGSIEKVLYMLIIKHNIENVNNLNVIEQFKDESWAQDKYRILKSKQEYPIDKSTAGELVTNKEIKNYIKELDIYMDFVNFLKNMAKKAEKQDKFTWEDVLSIANKFNITINTDLIDKSASGEAGVGIPKMSIRKKYQKTDVGVSTFFHELAHALLVSRGGQKPWSHTKKISISKTDWKNIFDFLGQSGKGEAQTSQTERYARLIQMFFMYNKTLKRIAPDLYKKVYSLIDEMAIYLTILSFGGLEEFRQYYKGK